MEEWEQRSLAAFRAIAREARQSSIVTNGLVIQQWLVQRGDDIGVEVQLLPHEPFRSLSIAVRNVYMEEGPAHFFRVHKIIGRYDAGEYRQRAAKVRADYEGVLRGTEVELRVGDSRIGHDEIFDAWLNDRTFHQDIFKDPSSAGLYDGFIERGLGPYVDAVVQKVVLQIGGCILELDDVIADWLRQDRLPRIAPPAGPTGTK